MSAAAPIRILAVDDDSLTRDLLTAKLGDQGHHVAAVENGSTALDVLQHGSFDLVVTDLDMPVMDGYQLIRRIRRSPEWSNIPVIVVTGIEDSAACENAFEAGATGFVTKPINWTLLIHQVSYVLRNSLREEALREAHIRAEKSVAFRDHLLTLISHELRTPLNAIVGFGQILRDELYGPLGAPDYRSYAGEIVDAGRRLNAMIGDALLASNLLAGGQHLSLGDFDAGEIMKSVVAEVREEAARRNVEIRINETEIDATCDSALLRAALHRLLTNAVRHAPEGTPVDLKTTADSDFLTVSVEDRGAGLGGKRPGGLLDYFAQGDAGLARTSAGLGLGLPIAKAVADLHGGVLELVDRDEGGLRASLKLPRSAKAVAALRSAA